MAIASVLLTFFLSVFLPVFSHTVHGFSPQHKHYIVYMGHKKGLDSEAIINSNHEMLASYVGSHEHAKRRFVHHYHKSFRGFSAILTPEEAKQLREHRSIVSVFESQKYTLQTTRSFDFIAEQPQNNGPYNGTYERLRNNPLNEVIIGSFDGGVWPESASFNPSSFGPPPKYFCEWGNDVTKTIGCNNKIIGARFYYKGYINDIGNLTNVFWSARDDFGHGTHTISTAAGLDVPFYNEKGEIVMVQKGGAPRARLAIYKTCWHNSCSSGDVLSAFDDAINDGVDIITMSLAPSAFAVNSLFEDAFTIGSFHAYLNGILIVACAGNEGLQGSGTVINYAPWVLTVAASSTDRVSSSDIVLANGITLKGSGFNFYDLINQEVVWANQFINQASHCLPEQLEPQQVHGKIVVCLSDDSAYPMKAVNVRKAGGIGVIFVDDLEGGRMLSETVIPFSVICPNDYQTLREYMNLNYGPTVTILKTKTMFHATPAPQMAAFSSRGPNPLIPEIIKPDITAPGLSILASVPRSPPNTTTKGPVVIYPNDTITDYMSGTSMATPHVSGVAAVLKSTYKNWKPSWIKSALMTTATWQDNTQGNIRIGNSFASPFEMGSGHIVPDRTFAPGLVYDMYDDDILNFLCEHAYLIYGPRIGPYMMGNMYEPYSKNPKDPMVCSPVPFPTYNLNYPSIAVRGLRGRVTVKRTLTLATKEGSPCVYRPIVELPNSIGYFVTPSRLDFRQSYTLDYYITFQNIDAPSIVYGSIVWTDDHGHDVRAPIVIGS